MLDIIQGALLNSLYFGGSIAVVAIFLAPLQFLKVLRQQTLENYSIIAKRYYGMGGMKVFFRGWKPYCLMQFISSSAFGLSEFLFTLLLTHLHMSVIVEICGRSFFGATFETTTTIHSELAEISKNKKEFMKNKGKVSAILLAILTRNTIFWFGGMAAYKTSSIYELSYLQNLTLAFISGVGCAILSIPFDAVATRSCGADGNVGMMQWLKNSYKDGGLNSIFAGAGIRILQMAIYTVANEIIMIAVH